MIIHTTEIIRKLNLNYLEEGKEIINVINGEDKIKIILNEKIMSTKEITKILNLTPRAIRKCLSNLERKGKVKRRRGKKINKNFRNSDYWRLIEKPDIPHKVPDKKILVYYKKEHYNKSYRSHYMFLPQKIILNKDKLSAIGFYDAEGSKTKPKSIEVVNSEPRLIIEFIRFLEEFGIEKENLSYRIIFNKKLLNVLDQSKEELESESLRFWENEVGIPKKRLRKFNYAGVKEGNIRINKIIYGSLNINYNSVLFRKFIFSLIKQVKVKIKKEGEIVSYLRGYLAGEAYVGQRDREIQIASIDKEHLAFVKLLLERIGIRCSINKETSTSPQRIIIANINSFLILESVDIFKFHPMKRQNLIKKILNYKSINPIKRASLRRKIPSTTKYLRL